MLSSQNTRSALKLIEKAFINKVLSSNASLAYMSSGSMNLCAKRNYSRSSNLKRMNFIAANQFSMKMKNQSMMMIMSNNLEQQQMRGYASLPKGGK